MNTRVPDTHVFAIICYQSILTYFVIISGDFDERQFDDGQFDEFKFDALQIWRKVQFGEKNMTKSTIWWNVFDEGQFDEIFEIV